MNKLMLVVFFLLFSAVLFAGPYGRIEAGVSTYNPNYWLVEANVGYKFIIFNIQSRTYGGWLTWSDASQGERWAPFMDIYKFGQEFKYDGVFIHFQHYCAHPVTSAATTYKDWEGNEFILFKTGADRWAGTVETITFGYEFEVK